MEVIRSKEDNTSFWKNNDYRKIGYSIYKEIWDEKSKNTGTPGQQHTPTENTMGSKDRVYQSLKLMAASYIACQNIKVEETCDLFYFNKIIVISTETSNGILHDGDILAKHLLVIGASVCIYPFKFAIFGEVGEATTSNYLKEKSNLFQSVE